jgi:hypothetical protein
MQVVMFVDLNHIELHVMERKPVGSHYSKPSPRVGKQKAAPWESPTRNQSSQLSTSQSFQKALIIKECLD